MDKPDYSMYVYYKGEKENPFEILLARNEVPNPALTPPDSMKTTYNLPRSEEIRLALCSKFWYYESVFESIFAKMESSDLHAFFEDSGLGNNFIKLLSEEDHESPTVQKKAAIFKLWLKQLFSSRLPGYETLYISTSVQ